MNKSVVIASSVAGVIIIGILLLRLQQADKKNEALQEQIHYLSKQVENIRDQQQYQHASMPRTRVMVSPYQGYYDPFRQLYAMHDAINQMMTDHFGQDDFFAQASSLFDPPLDMKEEKDHYVITVDLPGMDKDKIKVDLQENTLVITGEKASQAEESKNQYYRQERSYGKFMKVVPLPRDAKKDNIDAKYQDGVLTIIVQRQAQDAQQSQPGIVVK